MRIITMMLLGGLVLTSQAAIGQNAALQPSTKPQAIGEPHICSKYYPQEERKKHIAGTITLKYRITQTGTVTDISIIKTSGNNALDAAAMECVSHWLYKPATINSEPISVDWKTWVIFALKPLEKDDVQELSPL